MSNMCY